MPDPTPEAQGNLSLQLQELTSKYDINDRDFISMLALIAADKERAVREAEIKARLGMVEYYDQVTGNKDMDWKGLFSDNRKQLEYELAELQSHQEKSDDVS